MKGVPRLASIALVTVWAIGPAAVVGADTIYLKSGEKVDGRIVARGKDAVTVELASGGRVPYWLDEIERIEEAPAPAAQPAAAVAEPASGVEMFDAAEGAIRLPIPRGWKANESMTESGYQVVAAPRLTEEPGGGSALVVIAVTKVYHAAATQQLGAGSGEEQLNRAVDQFVQTAHSVTRSNWTTSLPGGAARIVEFDASPEAGVTHRVLMLAALRHDVLAMVTCEAPTSEFEAHRPVFEQAISGATLFSDDPAHPDNASRSLAPAPPPAPAAVMPCVGVAGVTCAVPPSWIVLPSQRAGQMNFQTGAPPQMLVGYIRRIEASGTTADAWARQDTARLASQGLQLTSSPTTVRVMDRGAWVTIGWQSLHGVPFRGEQFYLAGNGAIVEVSLSGPSVIFERMDRQVIYEFLASVRVAPVPTDATAPTAGPAPAGASPQPQPSTRVAPSSTNP